jgi:hypothetical protein
MKNVETRKYLMTDLKRHIGLKMHLDYLNSFVDYAVADDDGDDVAA